MLVAFRLLADCGDLRVLSQSSISGWCCMVVHGLTRWAQSLVVGRLNCHAPTCLRATYNHLMPDAIADLRTSSRVRVRVNAHYNKLRTRAIPLTWWAETIDIGTSKTRAASDVRTISRTLAIVLVLVLSCFL